MSLCIPKLPLNKSNCGRHPLFLQPYESVLALVIRHFVVIAYGWSGTEVGLGRRYTVVGLRIAIDTDGEGSVNKLLSYLWTEGYCFVESKGSERDI